MYSVYVSTESLDKGRAESMQYYSLPSILLEINYIVL